MYTIGIDEVGRGPVAGPVTICLFVYDNSKSNNKILLGLFKNNKLRDSKKLSAKRREEIYKQLLQFKRAGLVDWVVVSRSAKDIDRIGISKCLHSCISIGLKKLEKLNYDVKNIKVILDGALPREFGSVHIKGDEKFVEIALASIVAKVLRDKYMTTLSRKVPGYGFDQNAGYGTASHLAKVKLLGLTDYHRKSYLPRVLQKS